MNTPFLSSILDLFLLSQFDENVENIFYTIFDYEYYKMNWIIRTQLMYEIFFFKKTNEDFFSIRPVSQTLHCLYENPFRTKQLSCSCVRVLPSYFSRTSLANILWYDGTLTFNVFYFSERFHDLLSLYIVSLCRTHTYTLYISNYIFAQCVNACLSKCLLNSTQIIISYSKKII